MLAGALESFPQESVFTHAVDALERVSILIESLRSVCVPGVELDGGHKVEARVGFSIVVRPCERCGAGCDWAFGYELASYGHNGVR